MAWVQALLLAAAQGLAFDDHLERAMLFDFSVHGFIVATAALALVEQSSDARMTWLVGQLKTFDHVPKAASVGFAERRCASALAEAVILATACALSNGWIELNAARFGGGTWAGELHERLLAPTLAGWWALLLALPLFWFLSSSAAGSGPSLGGSCCCAT